MAKRYEYVVIARLPGSDPQIARPGNGAPWTAATAVAFVRTPGDEKRLAHDVEGCTFTIRRRTVRRSDRGDTFGSWMPFRAYVVGPDGIVRRTDR